MGKIKCSNVQETYEMMFNIFSYKRKTNYRHTTYEYIPLRFAKINKSNDTNSTCAG